MNTTPSPSLARALSAERARIQWPLAFTLLLLLLPLVGLPLPVTLLLWFGALVIGSWVAVVVSAAHADERGDPGSEFVPLEPLED